ncbi:MAG: hypothetical protein ACOVN0_06115 [Niveispirillum sp.]|uniref:hypothetical protein n=1 Tax=Niveispirillum sp. TaxID=1917217 RepID=UPI003BA82431
MASIVSAKRDAAKVNEGDWVRLHLEDDPEKDAFLRTLGHTDAFRDALARRVGKVAQNYGGNASRIPTAVARAIDIDLYSTLLFKDIRGLEDEQGQPVDFERFCDLIRQPDYLPLFNLCVAAVASIGQMQDEAKETAAKN